MPLSMRQILANIPYEPDTVNARYVNPRNYRGYTAPDGGARHQITTLTAIPGEKPRLHQVTVWSADPRWKGRVDRCPGIKISCDCLRFLYHWEYALTHHGASDIIYGNGKPPVEKNPGLHPAGCKHCVVAFHYLLRNRVRF